MIRVCLYIYIYIIYNVTKNIEQKRKEKSLNVNLNKYIQSARTKQEKKKNAVQVLYSIKREKNYKTR